MVLSKSRSRQRIYVGLLLLIVGSNLFIYRVPDIPAPSEAKGLVFGSIIDLAVIAPLLILAMTRRKGFTAKRFITYAVLGLIVSRLIVPAAYFEPFRFIPYIAIGVEGLLVLAELWLLFLFVKHLPKIVKEIKQEQAGGLFSFPAKVKERVANHPLVAVLAAELLMFYYAFASWKRRPSIEEHQFTLHRNTSLIAFYVMLLHAIVIETIGIHWWLHEKSIALSIVLLVLNVYSVLFFLADIQAVRLNPLEVGERHLRVSLGLGKRMEIPYDAIERVEWGAEAAACKLKDRSVIDFIAKDFEEATPQAVIYLRQPMPATLIMGFEKDYETVALRVDEPERFRELLETQLNKSSTA